MQDLRILSRWVVNWFTYNYRRIKARLRKKHSASFARATACKGMMRDDELLALYNLARGASKDGVIVEIGSYRGASTIALAQGSMQGPNIPVFAIDPHDFTSMVGYKFTMTDSAYFMQNILLADVAHLVRPITLFSYEVYDGWRRPISLLWIDGDHSYEAVKQDFERFSVHLLPSAPIVFHDAFSPRFGVHLFLDELMATQRYEQEICSKRMVILRPKS